MQLELMEFGPIFAVERWHRQTLVANTSPFSTGTVSSPLYS